MRDHETDIISRNMTKGMLHGMANSPAVTFHTEVPYRIGEVTAARVGFAGIPKVLVKVWCKADALDAVTPVVRQHVWRKFRELDIDWVALNLMPTVQTNKRRMVTDDNDRSPSFGKRKLLNECRFAFEIIKEEWRAAIAQKIPYGYEGSRL
jgi:hypothetical protein